MNLEIFRRRPDECRSGACSSARAREARLRRGAVSHAVAADDFGATPVVVVARAEVRWSKLLPSFGGFPELDVAESEDAEVVWDDHAFPFWHLENEWNFFKQDRFFQFPGLLVKRVFYDEYRNTTLPKQDGDCFEFRFVPQFCCRTDKTLT